MDKNEVDSWDANWTLKLQRDRKRIDLLDPF
jgi:hypothetical protein